MELFYIVGYIIHLLLLSWIIRKSTLSDERMRYDRIKIKILSAIAEKQSVSTEEIKSIIDNTK